MGNLALCSLPTKQHQNNHGMMWPVSNFRNLISSIRSSKPRPWVGELHFSEICWFCLDHRVCQAADDSCHLDARGPLISLQLRARLFQRFRIDARPSSQPSRFGMFFALDERQTALSWPNFAGTGPHIPSETLAQNSTKGEESAPWKRRFEKEKPAFDAFMTI